MIETVRLSEAAKWQLVRLKRLTGIAHWNTLSRWALSVSLADPSPPLVREIKTDSNIEMSWKTFAGPYGDIYLALLKRRCLADGDNPDDPAAMAHTLTIHLHRGIGRLAGLQALDITGLLGLALRNHPASCTAVEDSGEEPPPEPNR